MELEEAKEYVGDCYGMQMDGFDDCIVGVAERCSCQPLLVYDREKIISKLRKDGLSHEEASEYVDFNMAGAWVGEGTPLIMTTIDSLIF